MQAGKKTNNWKVRGDKLLPFTESSTSYAKHLHATIMAFRYRRSQLDGDMESKQSIIEFAQKRADAQDTAQHESKYAWITDWFTDEAFEKRAEQEIVYAKVRPSSLDGKLREIAKAARQAARPPVNSGRTVLPTEIIQNIFDMLEASKLETNEDNDANNLAILAMALTCHQFYDTYSHLLKQGKIRSIKGFPCGAKKFTSTLWGQIYHWFEQPECEYLDDWFGDEYTFEYDTKQKRYVYWREMDPEKKKMLLLEQEEQEEEREREAPVSVETELEETIVHTDEEEGDNIDEMIEDIAGGFANPEVIEAD